MNGFTLWILLAATGQVGQPENDFGWQIHPVDKKLEYRVHISPMKAEHMRDLSKEFASDIPPEVAARVSRVIVRFSSEPVISATMEEVMRVPPVATAVLADIESMAGRGRYSNLESSPSGDVINVSNGGLPGTPSTSLSDQARPLDANNLLAQNSSPNFGADSTRSATGLAAPSNKFSNTGTLPASQPSTLQGGNAMPSSTAGPSTLPSSGFMGPLPPSNNYGSTAGNYQTSPTQSSNAPQSTAFPGGAMNTGVGSSSGVPNQPYVGTGTQYGNPPYNNSASNNSASNNAVYGTQPSYGQPPASQPYSNNSPYTITNPGGYGQPSNNSASPPSGNFATVPRNDSQQLYNQYATLGNGNWQTPNNYPATNSSPSPYANDPLSLPIYAQPSSRIADSRGPTLVPSTSNVNSSGGAAGTSLSNSRRGVTETSTNDAELSERSGMNNIMPILFVLSLVVNFYLGMLIRKLLTRYRSLLSSVRSQAV